MKKMTQSQREAVFCEGISVGLIQTPLWATGAAHFYSCLPKTGA